MIYPTHCIDIVFEYKIKFFAVSYSAFDEFFVIVIYLPYMCHARDIDVFMSFHNFRNYWISINCFIISNFPDNVAEYDYLAGTNAVEFISIVNSKINLSQST